MTNMVMTETDTTETDTTETDMTGTVATAKDMTETVITGEVTETAITGKVTGMTNTIMNVNKKNVIKGMIHIAGNMNIEEITIMKEGNTTGPVRMIGKM